MKTHLTILLLALFLAAPVLAEEKKDKKADAKKPPAVKEATAEQYKKELKIYQRDVDTEDIDFKLEALKRFGKCVHKDVTKELLSRLVKDKDKYVREEAAKGLRHQVPFADRIGRKAVKVLENDKEDPRVLAALVRTLGSLKYEKAWEPIADLVAHEDDKVVIACFYVIGEWKELRAHREIQNFWDMYPEDGKWATGSVTVDTGTAGDGDQRAAKAKWKAKYGNKAKQRPRPKCVQALKAAVKKMTGEDIAKPAEWREWCKDNKQKIKAAERKK